MNMQQLQYLVEIERTCSISQAAANLYIGQPNLSRVLRDVEESVGFQIFERTRRGAVPTEKGHTFLQHARNILRELEFMENLGPNCSQPGRFRICLPRSYSLFDKTVQFLKSLGNTEGLNAVITECHPKQALVLVDNGSAEIAIIRYRAEYRDYFAEQVIKRELTMHHLRDERYAPVVSARCKLAAFDKVDKGMLKELTEISHRDSFSLTQQSDVRRIYTVDRLAQMQLLRDNSDMYLWCEQLPERLLAEYNLKQLSCEASGNLYRNDLIYKPQYAISQIEQQYIRLMQQR